MRDKGIFSIKRALPRMSWTPVNLYNLWARTVGPLAQKIGDMKTSNRTLFQQRWLSKALVRAYHGDYIPEKIFKRWYLLETLPNVRPRSANAGNDAAMLSAFAARRERVEKYHVAEAEKGLAPVGSLMFSPVERRIDVFIFRCCFTHSVYEARRLVIHGHVKLNGKKHSDANTRLAPGDMVSVDPDAIRFFKTPSEPVTDVNDYEKRKGDNPSLTPFYLPHYASPWLFIPAYIEPNFATCSAVYVRHPTARPGYSEIPTPYDADGDVIRFAWEWYAKSRPRIRSKSQLSRMPEDRAFDPTPLNLEAERKRLRKAAKQRAAAMSGVIL